MPGLKKVVSISLTILFLFQFMGCYFLYIGLSHQSKIALMQRLDIDDYDVAESITLKIPLTLPYGVDSKDYERVNGEFEHKGEFYKLIKVKYKQDTLQVVCLKDKKEKKLVADLHHYVNLSTDWPTSSKQASRVLVITLAKDYISHSGIELISQSGWLLNIAFNQLQLTHLPSNFFPVLSPPPDFIS